MTLLKIKLDKLIGLDSFFNFSLPYSLEENLEEEYLRLPWQGFSQRFNIPPNKYILRLYDKSGRNIPAQLFKVDQTDSPHDFLLVCLKDIQSEFKDFFETKETKKNLKFLRVEQERLEDKEYDFPRLEIIWDANGRARGAKLASGKLTAWFNFIAAPDDKKKNWYSGSATSVLLDNCEMLDQFNDPAFSKSDPPYWMCHHPEKRIMQLDKVQVWEEENIFKPKRYNPFEQNYELIAYSIGPFGVSITIASTPFSYNHKGDKCRIYRVISLYKNSTYLVEKIFVRREFNKNIFTKFRNPYLKFRASYFAFIHRCFCPVPLPHNKGFSIVSYGSSWAIYKFMSDVDVAPISHPTPDFYKWTKKYTCSWELAPCLEANSIHHFSLDENFIDLNEWLQ